MQICRRSMAIATSNQLVSKYSSPYGVVGEASPFGGRAAPPREKSRENPYAATPAHRKFPKTSVSDRPRLVPHPPPVAGSRTARASDHQLRSPPVRTQPALSTDDDLSPDLPAVALAGNLHGPQVEGAFEQDGPFESADAAQSDTADLLDLAGASPRRYVNRARRLNQAPLAEPPRPVLSKSERHLRRGPGADWHDHHVGGRVELSSEQRRQAARQAALDALQGVIRHNRRLFGVAVSDADDLFRAIDVDGSGSIAVDEFDAALDRLGLGLTGAQKADLWHGLDADRSGSINYEEFSLGLPAGCRAISKPGRQLEKSELPGLKLPQTSTPRHKFLMRTSKSVPLRNPKMKINAMPSALFAAMNGAMPPPPSLSLCRVIMRVIDTTACIVCPHAAHERVSRKRQERWRSERARERAAEAEAEREQWKADQKRRAAMSQARLKEEEEQVLLQLGLDPNDPVYRRKGKKKKRKAKKKKAKKKQQPAKSTLADVAKHALKAEENARRMARDAEAQSAIDMAQQEAVRVWLDKMLDQVEIEAEMEKAAEFAALAQDEILRALMGDIVNRVIEEDLNRRASMLAELAMLRRQNEAAILDIDGALKGIETTRKSSAEKVAPPPPRAAKDRAATVIQKRCRGRRGRRGVEQLLSTLDAQKPAGGARTDANQHDAATTIQRFQRGRSSRVQISGPNEVTDVNGDNALEDQAAVRKIQARRRGQLARRESEKKRLEEAREKLKIPECESATLIGPTGATFNLTAENCARPVHLGKGQLGLPKDAPKLQSKHVRVKLADGFVSVQCASRSPAWYCRAFDGGFIKIKSLTWNTVSDKDILYFDQKRDRSMAVKIQLHYPKTAVDAALTLQAAWRGRQARRSLITREQCAIIIQKYVRGRVLRNRSGIAYDIAGELRFDPEDGLLYSLGAFVECYGGTEEWDVADLYTRIDPTDSEERTRGEFFEKYGGYDEWNAAGKLDINQHDLEVNEHLGDGKYFMEEDEYRRGTETNENEQKSSRRSDEPSQVPQTSSRAAAAQVVDRRADLLERHAARTRRIDSSNRHAAAKWIAGAGAVLRGDGPDSSGGRHFKSVAEIERLRAKAGADVERQRAALDAELAEFMTGTSDKGTYASPGFSVKPLAAASGAGGRHVVFSWSWDELSATQVAAAGILGYSSATWPHRLGDAEPLQQNWAQLSGMEQGAARTLGLDDQSWPPPTS
eukprot:SAG31_NODE_1954_length_6828_cov_14.665775_1_plen_1205_part_00